MTAALLSPVDREYLDEIHGDYLDEMRAEALANTNAPVFEFEYEGDDDQAMAADDAMAGPEGPQLLSGSGPGDDFYTVPARHWTAEQAAFAGREAQLRGVSPQFVADFGNSAHAAWMLKQPQPESEPASRMRLG